MKNKRADLTSSQIIGLILVVIAFGILLIFLFIILDTESQTNRDTCHFSVISRGTSPEAVEKYIPLQCTTEKICLTTESGKGCDEFVGEKNVLDPIVLPKDNPQQAARIIEQTTANAMLDCWNMMGQGKLDVFSKGAADMLGFSPKNLVCVICSRAALNIPDKKIKKAIIDEVDINRYMAETKIPQKTITYLNAFTDESVSAYSKVDEDVIEKMKADAAEIGKEVKKQTSETSDEMTIVFSQIKSEDYVDVGTRLLASGATAAGAAFFTPGTGLVKKIVGGKILAIVLIPAAAGVTAYTMNNVHSGRVASAGYCGDYITPEEKAEGKNTAEGCSTVQVIPYEFSTINEICVGGIDGNP